MPSISEIEASIQWLKEEIERLINSSENLDLSEQKRLRMIIKVLREKELEYENLKKQKS